MKNFQDIEKIIGEINDFSASEVLEWAFKTFGDNIAIACSFSAEDIVLLDKALKVNKNVKVFTLDTGRLNTETYEVWQEIEKRYNTHIIPYSPDTKELEILLSEKGPFSFRQSIENRKECCNIRKVKPLKRALENLEAWITGLRKEQSVTRTDLEMIEMDVTNNLFKLNPLKDWNEKMIFDYIKEHDLPKNKLYEQGYASIGCEPCTRAIQKNEDIRSGRWWWEDPETKECGLHSDNNTLDTTDEVDNKILEKLGKDARTTYKKIAKEIGLSDVAVKKRIDKMMKDGIICRFTIGVDPKKTNANVRASIEVDVEPSHLEPVIKEFQRHNEFFSIWETIGAHNLHVRGAFKDIKHLNDVISELSKVDGILKYQTSILSKQRRDRTYVFSSKK